MIFPILSAHILLLRSTRLRQVDLSKDGLAFHFIALSLGKMFFSCTNLCLDVDNVLFLSQAAVQYYTKIYWAGIAIPCTRSKKQSPGLFSLF